MGESDALEHLLLIDDDVWRRVKAELTLREVKGGPSMMDRVWEIGRGRP